MHSLNNLMNHISKMGDKPDNKRPRQSSTDSETSGFMCNKCEFLYEKSVSCSGCKLSFCLKCARVTETLYNCIVAGEMDDFHWTCRSYKSTFPSLQNISASLEDFKGKYDYRMTNLEEKVNHIELTTKQEVTSQVSSMKEEIINSLKVDINSVVDKRNLELEDRKRRELNITFFNLMEHSSDNTSENKKADELDIRVISASLGIENLNITAFYRLGKKEPAKTRPLRVVLDSKSQRKFLLENAKYISSKTPETYQRVIIAKDLTPEQRKERCEKYQEKKRRKNQNQAPARHYEQQPPSPMDARAVTPPTKQYIYREPLAAAMVIQDKPPSPIGHADLLHESHRNMLTDSQIEAQHGAYDQSTITNLTNVDETFIGGLSQQVTAGPSTTSPH